MLGGIFDFLGGLLSGGLTLLTENLVVIGLAVFALALGFFAIYYLGRRRQTLDQQRMAAMIKGLHYAGIAREVLQKPKPDAHDHLLRGLRWLFGGAGVSSALYTYQSLEPGADADAAMRGALVGLIPGGLGLAHLLFSWICSRRQKQTDLTSSRMVYRAAARRY